MLYLYAFAASPAALPGGKGIMGGDLALAAMDGFDAVVGRLDAAPTPDEEAVLAHGRVVDEAASRNAAVVPVRFGAVFKDTESLRAAVADRAEALVAALERVRGCVELGVRVLTPAPPSPPAAGSGREYMSARLAAVREANRVASEIDAPLAALARASDYRAEVTPQLVMSGSYLVERDRVPAFRSEVEAVAQSHPKLTIACTGPWAPYSFGTIELGRT